MNNDRRTEDAVRSDSDRDNALMQESPRSVPEAEPAPRQVRDKPHPAPEPETARRPVPGVKHEPEPDAGNIMPAEDEPGTL